MKLNRLTNIYKSTLLIKTVPKVFRELFKGIKSLLTIH